MEEEPVPRGEPTIPDVPVPVPTEPDQPVVDIPEEEVPQGRLICRRQESVCATVFIIEYLRYFGRG